MKEPDFNAPLKEWAVYYASKGVPVFPCRPRSKKPAIPEARGGRGVKDATTHIPTIEGWWKDFPNANIGAACGHKFDAIDVEFDGMEDARQKGLKATAYVRTPGGGLHVYVAPLSLKEIGNAVKPIPGYDTRTEGGYVLLPPSFVEEEAKVDTETGEVKRDAYEGFYEWGKMLNGRALPPPPEWFIKEAKEGKESRRKSGGAKGGAFEGLPAVIPSGERNDTLFRYAARLRAFEKSEDEIREALEIANTERCRPKLSDRELDQIARSASTYNSGFSEEAKAKMLSGANDFSLEKGSTPEERDRFYRFTDLGNAERLVGAFGEDFRWCHIWQQWVIWDGTRWAIDQTGGTRISRMAQEVVRDMYREAAGTDDPDRRKGLVDWAKKCEARTRLDNMIALAKTQWGIAVTPDDFDRDPWLLTCLNGTLDLRTGELRDSRRSDMNTKIVPVEFDPKAKCPRWIEFLTQVLGGDDDLYQFVQKAIGYSLTGDISEQVMFFLHGSGQNGKSTMVETLLALMGDYGMTTESKNLMATRNEGIAQDVADMKGSRLVAAPETEDGRRLNEAKIKTLTGSDRLKGEKKYAHQFEFVPTHKLWMSGNHRPEIRGTDDGIWRRVALVPFTVRIPDDKRDKRLPQKLLAELPGILAWASRGCMTWQKEGLDKPEKVRAAVAEYREEMDVIGAFLAECTEQDPNAQTPARELYQAYSRWAKATGSHEMSETMLGRRMAARGAHPEKTRTTRNYQGFRVKEDWVDQMTHVYRGGE